MIIQILKLYNKIPIQIKIGVSLYNSNNIMSVQSTHSIIQFRKIKNRLYFEFKNNAQIFLNKLYIYIINIIESKSFDDRRMDE